MTSISNKIEENTPSSFEIFPNPFDGNILYGKVDKTVTRYLSISVFDILKREIFGKEVPVEKGSFSLSFPEGLKSGIYLVVTNNSNNSRITRRIVVK